MSDGRVTIIATGVQAAEEGAGEDNGSALQSWEGASLGGSLEPDSIGADARGAIAERRVQVRRLPPLPAE